MNQIGQRQQDDNPGALLRHSLYSDPPLRDWPDSFPFETRFSLGPVIEKWRSLAAEDPAGYEAKWAALEPAVSRVPELLEPIEDLSVLERNSELVSSLLSPLFSGPEWSTEARAVSDPYGQLAPFRTRRFEDLLGPERVTNLGQMLNQRTRWIRTMYAYRQILQHFYGFRFDLDRPLVFVLPVEGSDVSRYLKLNAASQLTNLCLKGELPNLDRSDLHRLLQNTDSFSVWASLLPPELFAFHGVGVVTLTDVTHETATASIKHIVLTSDANVTEENFDLIEQEVRNLYRNDTLRVGLASIQADGELNLKSDRRIWNSLVIRQALAEHAFEWRDTVYFRALKSGETVVIPDVSDSDLAEDLKTSLLKAGTQSLFLQPLEYESRTVGLLELSSPVAGTLDHTTWLKMLYIKSIFTLAVHQNLEKFENRVESIIQDTYTAIHPSVAWKFREAAISMIEREKETGLLEAERIQFDDLYPLYASADIRGSSDTRNVAIRSDILRHLQLARQAVTDMASETPMTILDELRHRISQRVETLEDEWKAGDDSEMIQFIRSDVDPMLESLAKRSDLHAEILTTYQQAVDGNERPGLSGRQAFESSLSRVNGLIVDMLAAEQEVAQRTFPHYFEHTKTDGVEHTMFVGQSLAPDHPFDLAFLEDLRLRQLIIACKVAREVYALNDLLELPLEIAQLILVQDTPISIRFRVDEKKFDVEGVSGIRFETLKKRLDKAMVAGTSERLTQPHRIAVVYSLEREEQAYSRYVQYLQANGYVDGEPEQVAVEDLQGISGLRALRFSIALE